jgi:DNA-binding MarR family transcriptional regulator
MPRPTDLQALIAAPTMTRRMYRRGGFEGLEANTMQVLIAVQLLGNPTVGDIVNELALAQGTVSTALTHLQNAGFVVPADDPQDRRRERQSITANGKRVVARFMGSVQGLA